MSDPIENLVYFVENEVLLLVTYNPSLILSDVIRDLREQVANSDIEGTIDDTEIKQLLDAALANNDLVRSITGLKHPAQGTFALLFVPVFPHMTTEEPPEQWAISQKTIAVIDQIYAHLVSSENTASPMIRSVTPNWLVAPSPAHLTVGGPGTLPVPEEPITNLFTDLFAEFHFNLDAISDLKNLQDQALAAFSQDEEPGVDVVILDAAPDTTTIQAFLDRMQQDLEHEQLQEQHHALIKKLFPNLYDETTQLLKTSFDLNTDLVSPRFEIISGAPILDRDYQLANHTYSMESHGLFVAGIIATLNPNARIKLVKVLNKYGVGTLETLINVLTAYAPPSDELAVQPPLVINCSLTITMPPIEFTTVIVPPIFSILSQVWPNLTEIMFNSQMMLSLQWIVNILVSQRGGLRETSIVAASGNEASSGTRYPAACDDVIGVGAVDENYSNKADTDGGIVTDGGELNPSGTVSFRPAMLGVFIEDFPLYGANNIGWARWSGTSFATPVVSGCLSLLHADYREHGGQPPEERLLSYTSANPTNRGEGSLDVTQRSH